MFTGIVEAIGTVKSVEKTGASGRISISSPLAPGEVEVGGSIAVDGACLTVTRVDRSTFTADISEETLGVTTLGGLISGARVNLETPLTLGKPLGGHLVTGHIDVVGNITGKRATSGGGGTGSGGPDVGIELEVSLPEPLLSQLVKKGSVAVDGISLTISGVTESGFTSAVIPHTLKKTTLVGKNPGDSVNIETDIIGKYVERLLAGHKGGGITEAFLAEHGFMKE